MHLGHYYLLKGNTVLQRAPDGTVVLSQPLKHWYGKAREIFEQAAQLDRAANERQRAEQARRGTNLARVRDVGDFKIYWNLGLINARLGNNDDAVTAYEYMQIGRAHV